MIDVQGYAALSADERRVRVAKQQRAYRAEWISVHGLTGQRHEPTFAPRVLPEKSPEFRTLLDTLASQAVTIFEDAAMIRDQQQRAAFIGPKTAPKQAPEKCRCEADANCLLLYRSVEYGFDLSDAVMQWLPAAVARVEAKCHAPLHYMGVWLDEDLAQDVTCQNEEPWEFVKWLSDNEDDMQLYAHRTEEGGRWIEAPEGLDGLAIDRDSEDYTSRIRSHEMGKLAALKAAMVELGLDWNEQLGWVENMVAAKRRDAVKAHRDAAAKAEKSGRYADYVAAPQVVSESQIRLRAYSWCLSYLRRGTEMPEDPSVVTSYTPEQQRKLDAAARIAAGYADDVDPEEAAREAWLAQF